MQCLYTCLDGFVLIVVLVSALPLKNLYLPDWFALRNTQPHTVGPFFNPLMQNKNVYVKMNQISPHNAYESDTVCFYPSKFTF